MWEKQAEAQTILKPQKENGKKGLPGGKQKAIQALGISKATFYRKLERLGIRDQTKDEFEPTVKAIVLRINNSPCTSVRRHE